MAPLDTLTTDTLHVAPVIETEIDEGRLRRQLDEAIEELPRRERLLVRGYRDERPLETTARRLGLSPSRAIHIKADGVDLLRKNFALPTAG